VSAIIFAIINQKRFDVKKFESGIIMLRRSIGYPGCFSDIRDIIAIDNTVEHETTHEITDETTNEIKYSTAQK
jgi:hypothetical protein